MFDEFAALYALKKHGTLALAGAHLRVEASTVWKRIQSLEKTFAQKLLEKRGRNAFLTPEAERLLQGAEPHLDALRDLLQGYRDGAELATRPLRVGLSESIALSWGPKLLKRFTDQVPQTTFELSTHRGSLLIEKLRHGDFDFILCAGSSTERAGLVGEKLFDEELLLYKVPGIARLYCIEESALSFEWMHDEISGVFKELRRKNEVLYLQSYGSIATLILNEIAGGIIPAGIAQRFKVPHKFLAKAPRKLTRPIYLYAKKGFYTSTLGNKVFAIAHTLGKEGGAFAASFR